MPPCPGGSAAGRRARQAGRSLQQSPTSHRPTVRPMVMLLLLHLLPAMLPTAALASCTGAGADRQLVLAKVRARVLEHLSPPVLQEEAQKEARRVHRRHILENPEVEPEELEDTSQVILFPSTDVPCEPTQPDKLLEEEGIFTYLFQPSAHTLSRTVTSAKLWFYTGPSAAPNHSAPDVLTLSPQGRMPVTAMVVQTPEHWTVFHFAPALLPQLLQPLFVLLVRCPGCPCLAEGDKMPFLVATTQAKGSERARRSTMPWSPAALSLLQHPSEDLAAHTNCRRASLNISFEELGWDKWIVHPSSFVFHYCHGSCAEGHGLSHRLGVQLCCAALPGTMRSLRVRTTSDGGYSFKYETVPNILAQDCTCV
ncbi:inhibin alpha chain [Falco peregrinus]|uniref:inhibin alpha chain n=1 Tax=Falco peregrinus TaxID=8954 RepID=UPI0024788B3B|nr:inhibin alpha chain [Falco peregrinus]